MEDLFSIHGKVALVTGGNRGVGFMIARGLMAAGARVYIASRNAAAGERAAAELSVWGECEFMVADVSSEGACRRLAATLAQRERRLDVLVNNAGLTLGAPLGEFGDAQWDDILAVNVKAVFHLTRFLLPLLEHSRPLQDPARIINIGSIDGLHVPAVENYSYTASKAAVHHLTRHLARRLAPKVTVNALALGPFESDMTSPEMGKDMALRSPLRRIGSPEDVAGAVQFLASRAGAFLTGTIIPVDGGLQTTA